MGHRYSCYHAAELVAHLPIESAYVRAVEPKAVWGQTEQLLVQIEYELRCLLYGMGGGKGRKPKPLEPPTARKPKATNEDMRRVADALGIPDGQRIGGNYGG